MSKRFVLSFLLFTMALAWGSSAGASLVPPEPTPLPKIVTSYGTFTLGKKPYPAGTRDAWIAEGRALARIPAGYLPASKMLKGASDNRGNLPPIGNQGSEGACVHWAGTYNTKSANMKVADPTLNLSATSNQCSPRFTYNLSNSGSDLGGYGHEPFEIFMRYGVPSLAQLPYTAGQYSTLPDQVDFIEGLHRRTTNYVWLWDWNPNSTEITELKTFLDSGGVASCGVYAESTFDAWGAGDSPWVGTTCTINDINHMVTVFGYGTGYYLVANSWGTSFGSNGYIVVDSDYFENYFSDILFPLEGTYEAATNYATIDIQHGTRSDIRSLTFTVNGTTAWNFSPLGKDMPLGGGSFASDTRNDLHLAVDLSSAGWSGAANTVTTRCSDSVSGTSGSLTNFTVHFGGSNYVSTNTPVSIPDNTGASAVAAIMTQNPTSPPTFGANPGPLSATTGVAMAFTVSASGNPTPGLVLQSQTASSGYSFTAGTGELSYTAPLVDVGSRTFTFHATNSQGTATQVVSVTVTEPPPAVPASIWASATNTTDFTAAWSSVSGATGYRLDVSTNASFLSGSGGSGTLIDEDFTDFSDWTDSGTAADTSHYGDSSPCRALGTGDALTSPGVDYPTQMTFYVDASSGGNGTTTTNYYSLDGGSSWNPVGSFTVGTAGATETQVLTSSPDLSGSTNVMFRFVSAFYTWYLDDVKVTGSSGDPSYIPGYSNLTVAGTSQSVTGLTAGATYYFRSRAVSGGGDSANSSVANVTTLSTLSAPVFGANPGPVATTAGVEKVFTVSASGVPTPTLALDSQTATSGYSFDAGTGELTYTPPQADAGSKTFTFSATNSQGADSQVVTVSVTAATAPAFTGGAGPYATTTDVEVAFTVSASGTPAPTLTLQSQTASSGYSFDAGTGELTYTPPEADEETTKTFTFTAANAAGVVTQTTSVAVSAAPSAPAAPAAIWASDTNDVTFTASWNESGGATSYRLDVATNDTFEGGSGGGGGTIFTESFETDGEDTRYSSDYAECLSSDEDYYGRHFNSDTDRSYTDMDGTYWFGGQDQDECAGDPTTLYVSNINVSGYTDLTMLALWAEERPEASSADDIDDNDYVHVAYQIDGGGWNNLLWFENDGTQYNTTFIEDTDFDGTGDGSRQLETNFQEFTNAISGTGSSLDIRIESTVQAGDEDWAVDNIRITVSGGSGTPDFVPGFSNLLVGAGTSQSVTGLTAEATYYFRARAVNGTGMSDNSPTGSVTTLAEASSDQTISFPAIAAQLTTNTVNLSATASSGLTVSFAVGSGSASIASGTTLTFSGAGSVSIVASQAGDGSWNPAPNVTNTFNVTKVLAGVTLSDLSHIHDGDPKSATVTTVPGGLSVTTTYDGSGTAPSSVGDYEVISLVSEAMYSGGETDTMSIVSVTNVFEDWVTDEGESPADPDYAPDADIDGDGATTWDEFLADTDPSLSNSCLVLTGAYTIATGGGTGGIVLSFPASTGRYYQLETCVGLTNHLVAVSNLGWGVPGMAVTNETAGTWYGVIRSLLQEP